MIPTVKDNITRNLGVTAKNSKAVITKQISTAKNDEMIIIFLSFIK